MNKPKKYLAACCVALTSLTGCAEFNQVLDTGAGISQSMGYNPAQLTAAVRETLTLSTTRASESLSREGGYSASPAFRITLPEQVQAIAGPIRQLGLGSQLDRVETLMNRGAELAAGEAKAVFLQAVREMTVNDALSILRGNNTAATDYFRAQTQAQLRERYRPIIQSQLQTLGFYNQYQQVLSAYKLLPLNNKPNLDLEERAVDAGVNALFQQIAVEEQKIRANPLQYGSALIAGVLERR